VAFSPRARTTSSFISGPEQGKPAGAARGRAGTPRESGPQYIAKLLASPGLSAATPAARELFIHLGYWPDPSTAGHRHDDLLDAQGRLNDRLLEMAGLGDGMRVYDVGCGVGGTLATIDARHHAMRLHGINCDARQLELAARAVRTRPGNSCGWVRADACALPFAAGSADRVVAIECAFHFPSRRRFLLEAARVLRPGGRLVLSDFIPSDTLRVWHDSQVFPGVALGAGLERSLVDSVGPWPDFWGLESDYATLAPASGLVLAAREDASAKTLPSYRCFLGPEAGVDASTARDPVDQAMIVLEWLQARGFLRMEIFAFDRAKLV